MAGFFALLYASLGLGSMMHEDVKKTIYMNEAKEKAIENGNLTYMDGYGNEYFIKTDTLCETISDSKSGHRIIRELNRRRIPTGRVLWDYDAIKNMTSIINFENALEKAKEKGMKYFRWQFPNSGVPGTLKFTGYDIEKQKKYIVSEFSPNSYCCYYLEDSPRKKWMPNGVYKTYYQVLTDDENRFLINKESFMERSKTVDEN